MTGGLAHLLSLAGQGALVTGAGGGIGAAIADALAGAGANVAGVDLPGRMPETPRPSLPCDLADPRAIESLFDRFDDTVGGLDILVHAAGITDDAVLWKMTEEAWARVMRVNLDAAFHLLRHAVPRMRERGGGSVVLIASINGERGKFGQANYAASKAGLIGLARTAAREVGRFGIRVNVVAPGLILTEMTARLPREVLDRAVEETAIGHVGKPEDVASAVLYLASGMARHVTGQVLRVDGGQLTV